MPAIAAGIADSVAAGGSLRIALSAAGTGLDGPSGVEMLRVGADLELGMSARRALEALLERVPSPRIDALVAAILSQERAGGDLAGLLRRHARAAAQRQRAEKEARSATAQARMTGGMVVAMPLIMGLLVELIAPGFLAAMLAEIRHPRRCSRWPPSFRSSAFSPSAGSGWSVDEPFDRRQRVALCRGGMGARGGARRGRRAGGQTVVAGTPRGTVAAPPAGAPAQRRRGAIRDAGLESRLSPAAVLTAKLTSVMLAIPIAAAAAPVAPGRFGPIVLVGVPAAAFLAPDLLLERAARARRERLAAALPDALDLMATGAATGRGVGLLLAEAMRSSSGPLREELARTVAAIECGCSKEQALRSLAERSRGSTLAGLAGSLERSRRHGSPLSRTLHEQAGSLRGEQRRELTERAARAAPKMQLAVALLLVPSVLLIVAAAIVANSGSLLPSF